MKRIFLALTFFCALSACKRQFVEPIGIDANPSLSRLPKKAIIDLGLPQYDTIWYAYNQDNRLQQLSHQYEYRIRSTSTSGIWTKKYTYSNNQMTWVLGDEYSDNRETKTVIQDGDKITALLFDDGSETYQYNEQNDLVSVFERSNISTSDCKDTLIFKYSSPSSGTTVCKMTFFMNQPQVCSGLGYDSAKYEIGKNNLVVTKLGEKTIYEFLDKKIELEDEITNTFLPQPFTLEQELIMKKYLSNKYCSKITESNGSITSYTYTFDNFGRLVKVLESHNSAVTPTIYTIIY